ncbi:hypothetical protein I6B53_02660 [Schaalia sp. 19OD2882]|uniref:cell division protein PerM n=1 Tax=Schaalia sp. 19OD2882 TaxID=2794089 RepID=UPI001C1EF54B|nr:DUF6350 family protein [Schaalia sp. 19OD2882]QWW20026.1 hypothetical protein I6B53_02660 [Schaalia sp. 19OD2882]
MTEPRTTARPDPPADTGTTRAASPSSTTVVEEGPTRRRTVRLGLPDGWGRGILSGVEAALIGWGLAVVPTLLAYLSVVSNPWLSSTTWDQALRAGTDVWVSMLGGSFDVGSASYRVVPTLGSVVVLLILRALLAAGRRFSTASHWFAIPGFTVTALGLAAALSEHATWWTGAPGALVMSAVAVVWAIGSHTASPPLHERVPEWLASGGRRALAVILSAAALGAATAGVAVWTGWQRIVDIHELLLTSTQLETVMSIIAQVFLAPSAAAWALSWLAGPGFLLGTDAWHGLTAAPVAPIPVVPLLGAVPAVAPGWALVLVPLLLGILIGVFARLRTLAEDVLDEVRAWMLAVVLVWPAMWVWAATTTISLGGGRLSLMGPDPVHFATAVTVEVAVTAALVTLASHPWTVETVGEWIAGWRSGTGLRHLDEGDWDDEGGAVWADQGETAWGGQGDAARIDEEGTPRPMSDGGRPTPLAPRPGTGGDTTSGAEVDTGAATAKRRFPRLRAMALDAEPSATPPETASKEVP